MAIPTRPQPPVMMEAPSRPIMTVGVIGQGGRLGASGIGVAEELVPILRKLNDGEYRLEFRGSRAAIIILGLGNQQ
jgi:hypothetical protein